MLLLEAAKPSLIDINFGLMFWTILTFLIVLVVLKKYAFGPIQATLDERRKAIADDLDAAENARKEAQTALDEYRQALASSEQRFGPSHPMVIPDLESLVERGLFRRDLAGCGRRVDQVLG